LGCIRLGLVEFCHSCRCILEEQASGQPLIVKLVVPLPVHKILQTPAPLPRIEDGFDLVLLPAFNDDQCQGWRLDPVYIVAMPE
jgi:hypothetical protein